MECLESGSIIVGRGDRDGISFIPVSSDILASRTRRQTIFEFKDTNMTGFDSDFVSENEQYLFNKTD